MLLHQSYAIFRLGTSLLAASTRVGFCLRSSLEQQEQLQLVALITVLGERGHQPTRAVGLPLSDCQDPEARRWGVLFLSLDAILSRTCSLRRVVRLARCFEVKNRVTHQICFLQII